MNNIKFHGGVSNKLIAVLTAGVLVVSAGVVLASSIIEPTINSVTVDGGSSTTVGVGGSVSLSATGVVHDNSAAHQWGSTGWRISTSPTSGGTSGCLVDPTPDFGDPSLGAFATITDSITAPGTVGTYNLYVIAYNSTSDCTGSAPSSTYELASSVIVKTAQTITTSPSAPASATYGDSFSVSATSDSGLVVSINASGACSGSGNTTANVTMTSGVGTCTVTYSQAGNINYAPATTTETTTTDPKALTVTGVAANSKTYDHTTAATLDTSSAVLVGVINSDDVSLDDSAYSADFSDANAGTGILVTVSGLALSGADAGNYTLTQPTGLTADITPASLTASITASNKIYDGNTIASTSCSLAVVIIPDDVTCTAGDANFDTASVGTGKTVTATGITMSGVAASNYTLVSDSAITTADITPASLTASVTASNKTYDGTTTATITDCSLDSVISPDIVTCSASSASFSDKNVGTGKTVTASGITITGTDAANYTLSSNSAITTADITAKDLTVTANGINKVYDGSTTATVTLTSSDIVGGDDVTPTYTIATFASADIGTDIVVDVSGISISGTDAGNYSLQNTTATTSADITANPATITLDSSNLTRTYDGTQQTVDVLSTNPSGLSYEVTYDGSATAPTDAGTYDVVATITDNNYAGTDEVTLIINKADATVDVQGYTGTYDGSAHGATGTATGVNAEDLSASLDLGLTFTDVPGGTANWTFTGGANYNDQNGSVDIIINMTDQTITFNPLADKSVSDPDFNVTATASSGLAVTFTTDLTNCTVSGNTIHILSVGSCTVTASQSGDSNYNAALDVSQSFDIANDQPKLTVTVTVVNNNTGTKTSSDFDVFVDATPVTSGAQNEFTPGNYTVSQTADGGYSTTIGGDCDSSGNVTLALGDAKTCTIINDDLGGIGGGGGGGGGSGGGSPAPTYGRSDINHDGHVDTLDFAILMAEWGKTGTNWADINHDGVVNFLDLAIMMFDWE